MVTCLDETRHGLEDGDFVTFTEVKGMEQLNGCEPRKVTVKGQLRSFVILLQLIIRPIHFQHRQHERPRSICIWWTVYAGQDAQDLAIRKRDERLQREADQQKSLKESLTSPEHFITDYAKFDRPATLHVGFQALSAFYEKENRLPKPRNAADADAVILLAKSIGGDEELDEKVVR